jgi:hypothetical protein
LTILRDKAERISSSWSAARVQREMKKYRNDEFEFTVRDVSFFDAADEQWSKNENGALAREVKPGAGLNSARSVGDLILEIKANPWTSGRLAAEHGESCRQQEVRADHESVARHSHRLPGN